MQLYHWHGVLQDVWAGDIVVLADTLEKAIELAKHRVKEHYTVIVFSQFDEDEMAVEEWDGYKTDMETIENVRPIVYDTPIALPFAGAG